MKGKERPALPEPAGNTSSNTAMNLKYDKDFVDFLAFALEEWSKTHIVLTSPRLIELFGEVLTLNGGEKDGK